EVRRTEGLNKMNCRLVGFIILAGLGMLVSRDVNASDERGLGLQKIRTGVAGTNVRKQGPIETTADKMTYNRTTGWMEARGNVVVKMGVDELRADYLRLNMNTKTAYAMGNVVLSQPGTVLRGKSVLYDIDKRVGEWIGLEGGTEPFYIINSRKTERVQDGKKFMYVIHDAAITTCNKKDHHHYHVYARNAELVPGHHLKVRGATWYFGRVPVFYVPYWYRILKEDFGFRFYPGHSSRMGWFLLSACRYRINSYLTGETHFDVRTERGVAHGQDFRWGPKGDGDYIGDISIYMVDDQKPIDDDEDVESSDIDSDRYRVRLRHTHNMSDRDYIMLDADFLSDTDVMEDFFEDEYRDRNQPDNYMSYTHRGDRFTASMLMRGRLNDFYTSVNRLPEFSLDIMKQPIGGGSVYYESDTTVSFLEKVWDSDDKDEYSTFRLDTLHGISHPMKHFGFLNVIPRAVWRGTYYSKTRDTIMVPDVQSVSSSTNSALINTNLVAKDIDAEADFRTIAEFGVEVSYKAFKTWDGVVPRRHIVEPYANYTARLEPSVLPENIYQFDGVDELDEEYSVKFGVRNKFQVKKNDRPFDVVDLDINTRWNFDPGDDEDPIENVNLDAELRPAKWLKIDLDGKYDVQESMVDEFNTQVDISRSDSWSASMEYRFRDDSNDLVLGDLTVPMGKSWAFNIYGRYRVDDARWEEQGGYVQRNLDCMKIKTGIMMMPGYTRSDETEVDDEWRITFEMWLTAFPKMGFSGKHRN
ncbi:MAG: LPS-assembly protein LptD, partial [Kiritimatiellae bacterium]|nr:LPS-assembly protein LptD [Kiritimatiellia bacterium]